ncbi:Ig-like domain-containing protein [Limnobaculum parvum]|uniref:Ig-like domain repeat protein n=1 Tax=Limnobaculum parvum TaxID=2172103 RepID=A0A2Y9U1A0_9GAMM|nr:Ig-like domain-containing protein [Limnobaculum parvum]AWH89592.1 Ig-like domain repeat protein [Limnobaculum parvum]
MAQENSVLGTVEVVARDNGAQLAHYTQGSQVVTLTQSSVVRIHGTSALVSSYERQGNDLIVHMKDGSTVRYQGFFTLDEKGEHSELVFDDGKEVNHAVFPLADMPGPAAAEAISPTYTTIGADSLLDDGLSAGAIAGILGALAVGAGIALAAGGSGGGGGGHSSSNQDNGGNLGNGDNSNNNGNSGNNGGGDNSGNNNGNNSATTPTITVNPFATDDVLNAVEVKSVQTLSGSTTHVEAGQTVTITLGGKTYTTQVAADGSWQVSVPDTDLQLLADGKTSLQVSVSNQAGLTAQDSHDFTVDVTPPVLTISSFAGDNTLDASESAANQTVSGTAIGAEGQIITITLGQNSYTATVDGQGNWQTVISSTDLQALSDGNYTVSASVSDAAGNSASGTLDIVKITAPAISISTFGGDDKIDSAESKSDQILSGMTQNAEPGSSVVVNISDNSVLTRSLFVSEKTFQPASGQTYLATVDADGSWHLTIPAGALEQFSSGTYTIVATVTNLDGQTATNTHTFVVDLDQSGISISIVSNDDYLSAVEATQDLSINGVTTGVDAGSVVTVILNSKSYLAIVDGAGHWSALVPSSDLKLLSDGATTITASVTAPAGTFSTEHILNVLINQLPQPTLDTPFGDGIVNAAEALSNQTLEGKSGLTGAGQTVVISLNGKSYVATVDVQGNWSTTIPTGDLQLLSDGSFPLVVKATDIAGNIGSVALNIVVDTTPPTLAIKALATDNILTASEMAVTQTISGSASITEQGQTVIITLNGKSYQALVGANGQWSTSIPSSDLQLLSSGDDTITVSLQDVAGNSSQISQVITVKTELPEVTILPFAGDDVLDGSEAKTAQLLSGSTTHAETGSLITVELNSQTYTTQVLADGSWSIIVPAGDLAQLANGTFTIQVSVTDVAGQTAQAEHSFIVDNNQGGIAIAIVATDDYLNFQEASQTQVISGTTSHVDPAQPVTVMLNGKTYTAIVQPDGSWKIAISSNDLQLLQDGKATITASVTDSDGNTVTTSHDFTVIIHDLPQLTIDTPFVDGYLNAQESQNSQTLSGRTGINGAGQAVIVAIGDDTYQASVDADGLWSVTLPAGALQQLPEGSVSISVSYTDVAGNTDTLGITATVDRVPPQLTVNSFTGDDRLNIAEALVDQTLSGTVSGADNGQIITVILNGQTYTTTVDGSSWSVNIPAADLAALQDGQQNIQVSVSDVAGNTALVQHPVEINANPFSAPLISVYPFAGNDVLSAAEQQVNQLVTGKVLNVEEGQTVTVVLGGQSYFGEVTTGGNWAVSISPSVLTELSDGYYTFEASVSDLSGNSISTTHGFTVDTLASSISVAPVTEDNYLNLEEASHGFFITGTSVGVLLGTTVTLTLNGKSYVTAVLPNGSWFVAIAAEDALALADGTASVVVSTIDNMGSVISGSHNFTVITTVLPAATINLPFGDGYLNLQESNQDQTLSGSTGITGSGQSVTVTINGIDYTANVDSNGNWQVMLPSTDLVKLDDGQQQITVVATDIAGNSSTLDSLANIDRTPPTLSVNLISDDNILNASEIQDAISINGFASLNDAGQLVLLTLSSTGVTYSGIVQPDGSWTIILPAGELAGVDDGTVNFSFSLTDVAGNTTTLPVTIQLDTAAEIHINAISGDNYINAMESLTPLVISGTSADIEPNQEVTIALNGKTYTTTIQVDGSWSYTVPADDVQQLPDGALNATVSVTDVAGNTAQDSHGITVITDTVNLPQLHLNTIAGNDVIDRSEAQNDVVISGFTQNITQGRIVSVTLNDVKYTAVVDADGNWSLSIPAQVVQGLPQGSQAVTVEVSDLAGNPATVTHTIEVDTIPPLLTIDIFAGNNVLNFDEASLGQLLSGTTEADLTVNITLNGVTTQVTADSDGHWQLALSASELLALTSGKVSVIEVSVADEAGNISSGSLNLAVATALPVVTLDQPFTDGLLNIIEATAGGVITGTTTELGATGSITITIGGQSYPVVVTGDGRWSATIPPGALLSLTDGTVPIVLTAVDSVGNTTSALSSVDALVHTLPIAELNTPLFGDDVLNLSEATSGQILTGRSGLTGLGQTVDLNLDDTTYSGSVDINGNWTVLLPPNALLALEDGPHDISVTISDRVGNNTTSGGLIFDVVIHHLPAPTIDLPFTDGILNAAEAAVGGTLTGSTHVTGEGQSVTVSINGQSYSATVDSSGNWSLSLTSDDLKALPDGTWPVTIIASDSAGNTVNGSASVEVLTHTLPNAKINLPFGDGLLNIAEANSLTGQVISGTTGITGAGQTVTVTIDGKPQTVTVLATGQWSVSLDSTALNALGTGEHDVQVTVTDRAGNTSQQDLSFNALLTLPTLTIEPPFGDGILNLSEAGNIAAITGTTNANISGLGATLTLTINGVSYPTIIDANGNWSANIPANALSTLMSGGTYPIGLTVTDAAGNSTSITQNFSTQFSLPQPTLATPFGDTYLSISESGADQTLSGQLNVVGDSSKAKVSVSIGGIDHDAIVNNDGTWSLLLTSNELKGLGNGDKPIVVTVTDEALNTNSVSGLAHFSLTPPTISINAFAGDNTLNYAESHQTQILSGTTSNVEVGQTVQISIGGLSRSALVTTDGSWSIALTPAELVLLASGQITATVADKAGNSADASAISLVVDIAEPTPFLTLDPVAGDNAINLIESGGMLTISGTADPSMALQLISLSLGNLSIPAAIIAPDGKWSVSIPSIAPLPDGNYVLSASTLSGATASANILVDRIPPQLSVGVFAGNDVLNVSEAGSVQILRGTGSEIGTNVSITLHGVTHYAPVQSDGSWSLSLSSAELKSLPQGPQDIVVELADKAGNLTSVTHPITVDTITPFLTVDALGVGNVLTAAEILLGLPLGGKGDPGDNVTVKLGPLQLSAIVDDNGNWKVNFPTLQLETLTDGPQVINVSVGDSAGNVTSVNVGLNVALNSTLGAGISTIFGPDGILNLAESLLIQTLSGTATGDYNGAKVSVTLLGQTFTANVGNNGKWSIDLTPDLWLGLTQKTLDVNIGITDANGNTVNQLVHTGLALTDLPVINNIIAFGDNFLNKAETALDQLISGKIGNMAAGTSVSVTLGTNTYSAGVDSNGNWSVSIPKADLTSLLDGITKVGVTVTDAGGNVVKQSIDLDVITHNLPTIKFNPLFGDGVLSLSDLLGLVSIGGTATGLTGRTITLSIAGSSTLSAVVGDDGSWSVALTPSIINILKGIGSGDITVSASATDIADNPVNVSAGVHLSLLAPLLQTVSVFGDGLLNAVDASASQLISGTIGNAPEGTKVSVLLGGKTFAGITLANGSFSIALLPSDLSQLPDGPLTAAITITTPDGNTNTGSANVVVGLKNLPQINLDPLFNGDGFLNHLEAGAAQLISGTVTNLTTGSVAIKVGDNTLTATINPNGTWSTTIPSNILSLLPDGPLAVSVSVSDSVGNTASAGLSLNTIIHNLPTISIGSIFGDGILSLVDLLTSQVISGTSANLAVGAEISVKLGSLAYTAKVGTGGAWSLSIPPLDLKALLDGNFSVDVSVKDVAGNVATSSGLLNVISHVLPTLSLDSIFNNGGLNATDILNAQVISGSATNAEGSIVNITLGLNHYTATVDANGKWTLSVPKLDLSALADGNFDVNATLTNAAGEVANALGKLDVITHNLPDILLGSLFGNDSILNILDAGQTQTLSGTLSNLVGGSVVVSLGSTNYTATVGANGTWSLDLSSSVLNLLKDGSLHVGVTVTDKVGNSKTIGTDVYVKLSPPLLSYNPLATLDIPTLLSKGLTIGGSSRNLKVGAEVNVSLLGLASVVAQVKTDGSWSANIHLTLLQLLSLNLLTPILHLSAQDEAQNGFSVDLGLGTVLNLPLLAVTAQAEPLMHEADASANSDALHTTPLLSTESTTEERLSSTLTSSNDASATAEKSAAAVSGTFTIGGVSIDLADGTHNSGSSVQGGSGNDVIHLSTLGFSYIDGGAGVDTLVLDGANLHLDLTQLGEKITHIDIFDLGLSGSNSITLDLNEALNVKDPTQEQLLIKGSEGDKVNLVHGQGDIWNLNGQSTIGGVIYDVYHNSSQGNNTLGDVLVQQGLHVNLV